MSNYIPSNAKFVNRARYIDSVCEFFRIVDDGVNTPALHLEDTFSFSGSTQSEAAWEYAQNFGEPMPTNNCYCRIHKGKRQVFSMDEVTFFELSQEHKPTTALNEYISNTFVTDSVAYALRIETDGVTHNVVEVGRCEFNGNSKVDARKALIKAGFEVKTSDNVEFIKGDEETRYILKDVFYSNAKLTSED